MQDGMTMTLAISSANLIALFGIMAKLWLASKPQRIEQPIKIKSDPQERPLDVRAVFDTTPKAQCDERHKLHNDQIEDLYGRTRKLENQQAAYEATMDAVRTQLGSMDGKLDKLIKR